MPRSARQQEKRRLKRQAQKGDESTPDTMRSRSQNGTPDSTPIKVPNEPSALSTTTYMDTKPRIDLLQDHASIKEVQVQASRKKGLSRQCCGLQPRKWICCRCWRHCMKWIFYFRDWVMAFFRALPQLRWADLVHLIVMVVAVYFAGRMSVDFLLHTLRPVAAQTTQNDCSVVYVTIPGPIITISLTSPPQADPSHGTYYYSVINGTTGWLNSQAPPSEFRTLPTITLSAPGSIPSMSTVDSRPGVLPPIKSSSTAILPPGSSLSPSFTTSIQSSTVPLSTSVLSPSSVVSSSSQPMLSLPTGSSSVDLPPMVPSNRPLPWLSTSSLEQTTITTSLTTVVVIPPSGSPSSSFSRTGVSSSVLPNPPPASRSTGSVTQPPVISSPSVPAPTPSSGLLTSSMNVPSPRPSTRSSVTLPVSSMPAPPISSGMPTVPSAPTLSSPDLSSSTSLSLTSTSSGVPTPTISLSSSIMTIQTSMPTPSISSIVSGLPSSDLVTSPPIASSTVLSSSSLTSSAITPISSSPSTLSSTDSAPTTLETITSITTSTNPPFITSSMWGNTTSSSSSSSSISSSSSVSMQTRVLSYGDTSLTFVFPTPNITTTVSYWTGTYPTVTGPLPSDLATLSISTRTAPETPVSPLPSIPSAVFPPGASTSMRTVVKKHPRKFPATRVLPGAKRAIPPPEPTPCGEYGMFNITFDDATFVVQNRSTALPLSPLTNPYHHMFFANGFVYMPDSWEPYPSISQPNVAMVLPFGAPLLKSIPFAGSLLPGEFGAGPRAAVSAYWFNAHSGYFGCALNGITPCTLRISGYRYDPVGKKEVLAAEQTVSIPACPLYIGCKLMRVDFNEGFTGLSGIQFNAYTGVLNVPQVFMMDSLGMEWWNNTCEAGILRIGHR